MKIASWNVNSIRARLENVTEWLMREQPDVLMLQELKCETEHFPSAELEKHGYHCTIVGQKSYNGVAILSKEKPQDTAILTALPGWSPAPVQARYVEITLPYPAPTPFSTPSLTLGNLYAPNGNSGGEEGFKNKLAFFAALKQHALSLIDDARPFLLAGDYNICPTPADYAPKTLSHDDALIRPAAIEAFRGLKWCGLTDAVRTLYPEDILYTFWDYQAGAWSKNQGLRIDHFLLSPTVTQLLANVHIDKEERSRPHPSDHVPVWITLANASPL